MNENTVVQMRYPSEQEMQYEESTIDDSSIQPNMYSTPTTGTNDWSAKQNNYSSSPASYSKSQGKGSKKVKSEDDEDIDIDNFVQTDVQRIPVKTLRKIIPKLRIAVYCADLMTSGKRKLKHLWDERPMDWPHNIPFKDPNNACKDVKKPGKDELGPMFNFLKQKYIQNQGILQQPAATSFSGENDYKYSHQVMAESSTDKEAAFYSSVSSNPILPQIPFDQQTSDHSSIHLVSPKPEPSAYVDISELMSTPFRPAAQQQLFSLAQQENVMSVNNSKPQPVIELFGRMEKKYEEVINLSPQESQGMVVESLRKVQQAVIRKLYDEITPGDTRVCLMFLDAGHQMEALLDVMLVLKQVDLQLLDNGCQEIIKKFNMQIVSFVSLPQLVPQLSETDRLLQNNTVSSSVRSYSSSCSSKMPDDSPYGFNTSDDIFRALGLDLYDNHKDKACDGLGNPQEVPGSVPLFRPRHGTGGCVLEDSGLGIETRLVTSPSRDGDNGKHPVMLVVNGKKEDKVGEDSISYPLSPQQQVEKIMRHLKDSDSQFSMTDNRSAFNEFPNDNLMWNDISDIIMSEQPEEPSSSAQMGSSSLPNFCQETRGGYSDQHQLLPSSASSMIPSMVESAICADSETEDSDDSSGIMDWRPSGGRIGDRGFVSARPFDRFAKNW